MGLENTIAKLDEYLERLAKGKAKKIKPSHLAKIEKKLKAKEKALKVELAEATKESKKARISSKLTVVHDQLERAKWLSGKIED